MGSAASTWIPPERDDEKLDQAQVIEIVGNEFFDEKIFLGLSGGTNEVTVEQLKECINNYAKEFLEKNVRESIDNENIYGGTGTNDDQDESATFNDDQDESATFNDDGKTNDNDNSTVDIATKSINENSVDAFSVSVETVAIVKLSESDMITLFSDLKDVSAILNSSIVDGIYPKEMKPSILKQRELNTLFYKNTNDFYSSDAKENVTHFLAEYFHMVDNDADVRTIGRYYTEDSTLKFSHNKSDIVKRKAIASALVTQYRGLHIRHKILTIDMQESPPNGADIFLSVVTSVQVEKDAPRKVIEVFYLKKRVKHRSFYGPYFIWRHVIVDRSGWSRPLYVFAEGSVQSPLMKYDNWDTSLQRPEGQECESLSGGDMRNMEGSTMGDLTVDGDGSGSDIDDDGGEGSRSEKSSVISEEAGAGYDKELSGLEESSMAKSSVVSCSVSSKGSNHPSVRAAKEEQAREEGGGTWQFLKWGR